MGTFGFGFVKINRVKKLEMASFLEDINKTVAKIRNDLICQICKGYTRPGKKQWYRCLRMHQICQDCVRKNCSCGHPISLEHCKMTEEWLNVKDMKFNCVNTKNGCQETHFEYALEDHESECIYRVVPCPYEMDEDCEGIVIFQNLIQHIIDVHIADADPQNLPSKGLSKKIFEIFGGDNEVFLTKFSLNNQTFLLAEFKRDEILYFWLWMLGSPMEAKHFSYTLTFFGQSSELSFKGKVASIDESFETLSEAGKYFSIPKNQFCAQFLGDDDDDEDEDDIYEYSLEIKNLKEEVKDDNYESGISDNEEDSKE